MSENKNNNKVKKVVFPKWANKLPAIIAVNLILVVLFLVYLFSYWFSPSHLEIGYQPLQPIPYRSSISRRNVRR